MQSHHIKILPETLVQAIRTEQLAVVQSLVTAENIEAVDQYGYTTRLSNG